MGLVGAVIAVAAAAFLVPGAVAAAAPAGEIVPFDLPGDGYGPEWMTSGPDGNVWFARGSTDTVGRIAPDGTVVEYPVPHSSIGAGLQDITTGPDGNLWFVAATTRTVNKLTTSGDLTAHALPDVGAHPREIVTGADGNLWLTDNSDQLWRVTPQGVPTKFPLGAPSGRIPWGITAGPDGNVWFTSTGANRIGRITPSGVITEFTLPTPSSAPRGIVTGPDGNLWVTLPGIFAVARITPTGVVTEFPIGHPSSPNQIVVGPDGNLWFTGNGVAMTRLSTDGAFREFPIAQIPASGLAIGSDGNLWYSQSSVDRIARLGVDPPAFSALSPARLLDTRTTGPLGPAGTVELAVTGTGGVPATGVGAVVLNVTSTQSSAPSFVTVWPTGDARPNASNLNTQPGQDTPNLVIAKVGANGRVTLYNDAGTGHLIADVLGWFPTGDAFSALSPARLLDTRTTGPLGPAGTVELAVTGTGGVPATGVGAVVLNVTSTQSSAPSFVTVWPTGDARPNASNLNTQPGQDTPNLVIAKVGANGRVTLYNDAGTGHLIADVLGWFPTGDAFSALSPARLLDTRTTGPLGPAGTVELAVTGTGGVPATGVGAVVLNVTSTQSSAPSFVTVWPTGDARPNASNLNTQPGQDTPNLVIAKVGANGRVTLYNDAGTGHLIADVLGWFPG